jgi:hypothetical protein
MSFPYREYLRRASITGPRENRVRIGHGHEP